MRLSGTSIRHTPEFDNRLSANRQSFLLAVLLHLWVSSSLSPPQPSLYIVGIFFLFGAVFLSIPLSQFFSVWLSSFSICDGRKFFTFFFRYMSCSLSLLTVPTPGVYAYLYVSVVFILPFFYAFSNKSACEPYIPGTSVYICVYTGLLAWVPICVPVKRVR